MKVRWWVVVLAVVVATAIMAIAMRNGHKRFSGTVYNAPRIEKTPDVSSGETNAVTDKTVTETTHTTPTNEPSHDLSAMAATKVAAPIALLAGVGGNPDGQNPEDRDEDFSVLATADIIRWLSTSTNAIEMRKAAQVLGDRAIAGTLELSAPEQAAVVNVARQYLTSVPAREFSDFAEAKEQIERLWRPAGAALVAQIANPNTQIAEMAIQSLSLMRNEELVRALVEQTRSTTNAAAKVMYIFALGCMTEQYNSLVPRRVCMNEKESAILADKLIRPYLADLEKTETAADMKNAIRQAEVELTKAADHRPRPVPLEDLDDEMLQSSVAIMEQNGARSEILAKYRAELEKRRRLKEQM